MSGIPFQTGTLTLIKKQTGMDKRQRKKNAKKAVTAHYTDMVRGILPPGEVSVRIKCTFRKKRKSSGVRGGSLPMDQLMRLVSMGAANYSVGTEDVDFRDSLGRFICSKPRREFDSFGSNWGSLLNLLSSGDHGK